MQIKNKILYLITGPSGAGKSTYAHKLITENKVDAICEADYWMTEDGSLHYKFNLGKLNYCHKQCQQYCQDLMNIGMRIAVSNTTLTKWEARPYIELARKYGYTVEIVHLTSLYKNTHGVSNEKVMAMQAKREFFKLEDFS